MSYKWKPSKTVRREFSQKMQNDPEFADAYNQRKQNRIEKRRESSQFDYSTAGGNLIPTRFQYDFAMLNNYTNDKEKEAFDMIVYGFCCNEKIHHDYIHIVNELIRKQNN